MEPGGPATLAEAGPRAAPHPIRRGGLEDSSEVLECRWWGEGSLVLGSHAQIWTWLSPWFIQELCLSYLVLVGIMGLSHDIGWTCLSSESCTAWAG